jgi:YVTN family beta-propeller protein
MKRRLKGDGLKILRVGCIILVTFLLFSAVVSLHNQVQAQTVPATIPVGQDPEDVAITPNGAYVYVTNLYGNSVSVINTATNTVTTTIPVGINPYFAAVTPNGAYVYVTNSGGNSVSVISTATNTVTATIPVGPDPFGVAVTPNGAYVYVTNYGGYTVSVISTATNTVTGTVNVGFGPIAVAVTPNGAYAYVTNFLGDSGGNSESTVSVINTATNTVTTTIPVGINPFSVAVTLNGAYVYVANSGDRSVSVISTTTNTVTETLNVGDTPTDVTVTPNGAYAYVTNLNGNSVSVINTATNTVTATLPFGIKPGFMAVTPNGAYAYVTFWGNNSVSMMNMNAPTVTVSPSSWTLNVGQSITFSAAPSGGSGTYTNYQWYVDMSVQSGQTAQTFSYSSASAGSFLITARVTDNLGATSPQSNAASVIVNPAPTPTPTATPTQTATPNPTANPTTTPPTSTPKPSPSSTSPTTNTPSPIPVATPNPTPTPISFPNSTSTTETATPLVRNSSLSTSILNIPSNPVTPQLVVTTSAAAGAIGIVSLASIAFTRISRMTPTQIENLPLPKPLQSLLKKFAEKKIEIIFKKKKLNYKKRYLITKRELLSLSTTIIAMSFVVGFVMANGLPNVLNPLILLRFFAGALLSVFITQTISFFLDIYFSNRSKVQKELKLWGVGSVLFFISGLILKFPFSSTAKTDTFGSYRYKLLQQKKVDALIAIAKALVLSLPIIPFAVLTISPISDLVVVGSAGMLTTLTSVCFALAPISPSSGKDIFDFRKPLATVVFIPAILLILFYLGWLTFWGYLLIGIVAAILMPILLNRIQHEKRFTSQTDANLWFK